MNQECKILSNGRSVQCWHDDREVTLFVQHCACCYGPPDEWIKIKFCPVCGFQPERLSEKTSKEEAIV